LSSATQTGVVCFSRPFRTVLSHSTANVAGIGSTATTSKPREAA
jgi:hypothetical protein